MRHINKILKKYNSIPIAAKATIWFMICSVVQKCISLITTPVFTRLMTTEQYGQFSVYNSWLQIFYNYYDFTAELVCVQQRYEQV